MRALSRLPAMRARAVSRMTSTATVYREAGLGEPDQETGVRTRQYDTVHTAGPFRLGGSDSGTSGSRTQTVGGVEVVLATRTGHFPVTVTGLRDDDLIEIETGENAGTVWRILEADFADQQTARRVPVIAVQRPEGLT